MSDRVAPKLFGSLVSGMLQKIQGTSVKILFRDFVNPGQS